MKKLGVLWLGYTALVLLSACVHRESEPLGPEPASTEMGEAEIRLPALPEGFLAKRSAGAADPMFILTISGNGMVTRKHAWPLTSASGAPIKVVNIPVGQRLFTGQLDVDGSITHADSQWVPIEKGKTAQVNLKLASSSGNANVCVEIEGFPPPVGCKPPAKLPDVSGCYGFTVGFPVVDTVSSHVFRIFQADSSLVGVIDWDFGASDTSRGLLRPDGWMTFGQPTGDFYFSGSLDANGRLSGKFFDKSNPVSKPLTGYRRDCVVIRPVDPSLTCYEVSQALDVGGGTGRLVFRAKGGLQGVFQWVGYETMSVTGSIGAVNGLKTLWIYGRLPTGLAKGLEGVHYKGQIATDPGASIVNGTVYGTDSSGTAAGPQRGHWKGYAKACLPGDGLLLDKHHGF